MKTENRAGYGSRYGKKVMQQFLAIQRLQRGFKVCPSCFRKKLKRSFTGVWHCRFCDHSFSGNAYKL